MRAVGENVGFEINDESFKTGPVSSGAGIQGRGFALVDSVGNYNIQNCTERALFFESSGKL